MIQAVCDKDHPENSLVHIIAARGGIGSREVNCGNLPFDIPYVVVGSLKFFEREEIKDALNPSDYNMIVTPKEIDELIENMSNIVARGINMSL